MTTSRCLVLVFMVAAASARAAETPDATPAPSDDLRRWAAKPGDAPRVRLLLSAGADAQAAAAAAKAVAGTTILGVEREPSRPSVLVGLAPAALAAALKDLAGAPGLRAIVPEPVPRPALDHVTWWLQSGDDVTQDADYALSAPLFARGLTGRGLLLAMADTGLENDDCHFRYGSGVAETGWPLGPPASSLAPVPDEEAIDAAHPSPLRTRDRKVVAYYVQSGGAQAYSEGSQHGTSCATAAVGDAHAVLAARPLVRDLGERQDIAPFRAGGAWSLGQELRADLAARVDDPASDDPAFPNAHGALVEHHAAGDGVAPGAQLVVQDIGNDFGELVFTDSVRSLLDQASRTGATTWLGAWGAPPCTACYAGGGSDADDAAWRRRDLVVVASAGNDADLGISRGQAHAKSAVTVGATIAPTDPSCGACPSWSTTRLGEAVAAYSSQGPSPGRIVPLLVAPGTMSVGGLELMPALPEDGTGSGDDACGSGSAVAAMEGTSLSAAVTAGLSLLVQQYFLDGYYPSGRATPAFALRPTNALVRAVLVNSARDLLGAGTGPGGTQSHRPNTVQGWGAPRLDDTLYFDGDPTPLGDGTVTELPRLLVMNDAPNGFDGSFPLAPEPGGRTRDVIVANFHPAIMAGQTHAWFVDVDAPVTGPSELRFTLAWSDVATLDAAGPVVNDIDLEVVSPGPNGLLETAGPAIGGDDVLYRADPATEWDGGFSRPSADASLLIPPFDRAGRDAVNTVENVFVRPSEAHAGTWLVRVVATSVRGIGGTNGGWPNFALDQVATRDTNGDGVPDVDEFDTIRGDAQGYALIATGDVVMPTLLRPYVPRRGPVARPPTGPRIPPEVHWRRR